MLQGTDGLAEPAAHDYPRSLGIRSVLQGALEDARICEQDVSLRAEEQRYGTPLWCFAKLSAGRLHPWSISPWRTGDGGDVMSLEATGRA